MFWQRILLYHHISHQGSAFFWFDKQQTADLFLPYMGALWKKKLLYTVIEYNDGTDEQTIILDFGKKIEEIQPCISKNA